MRTLCYACVMANREIPKRVTEKALSRLNKDTESGCWEWTGALASGYGRMGWVEDGKGHWDSVHRIVWMELRGEIPEDADLDHLCHDPSACSLAGDCPHRKCANPDHLEPVTRKENLSRGGTVSAMRSKITHCPEGHEYTGDNVRKDKKNRRICAECTRRRNREYYHKNKERRAEYNREWRQRNIGQKGD